MDENIDKPSAHPRNAHDLTPLQASYNPMTHMATLAACPADSVDNTMDVLGFSSTFTLRHGIPLPPDVDCARTIKAVVRNGVVTLELPKLVAKKVANA
jgi:pseudouridine-5'-phosphate glycosidase